MTAPSARQAYDHRQRQIEALVARLRVLLAAHREEAAADRLNWGYVGDLGRVIELLGETVSALGGQVTVQTPSVKPGDRVTVSFSMVEGEERIRVLEDEYTVHWRGNTVLGIEPQGKIGPLYQRSFLQKAEAPLTEYSYHTPSFQIRV